MYKLTLALFSLFFLIASPAGAAGTANDNWVVTQLSGDARVVHPGAQPASLHVNNQLIPGDVLLTGPSGRATLVHGGDYIIVAPRSQLRLPSTPQPTGFTRVIQNLGTLLFKVQHTGIPHFAVDTPMLAAVVKGTTFTVVVDQQRSAVQVIQGVVQVTALDGGMSRMVEGGRTVFIEHAMPKQLKDADKPLPATISPSATSVRVSAAGDVPLATIATLTGGLVRADLSSPQPTVTAAPVVQAVTAAAAAQSATPTATNVATATGGNAVMTTAPVASVTATVAPAPATTTPAVAVITTAAAPTATAPATTTPSVTVAGVTVGSVSTPSATIPAVTVSTTVSTPTVTVPSATTPSVTVPSVSVALVSTPAVTVPPVTTPSVTIPTVTVASNSGPGSLNSGPGSLSSGSGSGSGSPNSGPGSLSSGSGSGSAPPPPAPTTAPILTVSSITTPIVPITTPTITVTLPPRLKF